MRKNEVNPGGQIRNLLIYGTDVQSQIVLPERPSSNKLVHAKNFTTVPYLLDALPRSDGRPYAIFNVPAIELPSPKIEENQPAVKPTVTLILVPFSDPTNVVQNMRQVNRGMQRAWQYGKLIKFIDNCERKIQQGITPHYSSTYHEEEGKVEIFNIDITAEALRKLKHVAASFYADELAKEPLTKELAEQENARTILQEEAVVAEAERIIFDHQRQRFTDFEVKHTEMLNQTNQPAAQAADKEERAEKEATTSVSPETASTNKKDGLKEKTLVEAVEAFLRLDLPSKKAGAYVRELWNRPY
ncbi:MAG: hypothetical protein A3D75_02745 [Candidatus Levybacteria bacterium RIFCSPHIGHO2_02_FULL_37_18]|nr:MAG: hypothetical protein A3D75_02745 [Candidatus Levybacteria bacterium RIFCSPHIGHO2_02_FULL_37_18]OGH34158.1 MAG: hypothetical protein A3A47_03505 [Candidatus Levybacteria bacterium RIFCSPLOWO2_01_FULL_37_20]OGH44950.1 MAG: hypothetical protein A3J14_01170 [Candidatus Levybacteria bacterium RIFCSPLOWO2_02_FULL_37_18]